MPPSATSRTAQPCPQIDCPREPPEIVYSGGDCPAKSLGRTQKGPEMWTASSKKASFEDKVWGNWIPSSLKAYFEDRLGGGGSTRPESGPNSPLIKIICGGKVPLDAVERGWGQQVAAWGVHLRS